MSETKKINRTKKVPICDVCNEESASQGQTVHSYIGLLVDTEGLWVCGSCLVERAQDNYDAAPKVDAYTGNLQGEWIGEAMWMCIPYCEVCEGQMDDSYHRGGIIFPAKDAYISALAKGGPDYKYLVCGLEQCISTMYQKHHGYKELELNDDE